MFHVCAARFDVMENPADDAPRDGPPPPSDAVAVRQACMPITQRHSQIATPKRKFPNTRINDVFLGLI
jgi:hypothetical protein